jgi:hypothetical protein
MKMHHTRQKKTFKLLRTFLGCVILPVPYIMDRSLQSWHGKVVPLLKDDHHTVGCRAVDRGNAELQRDSL